MAIKKKKQKKMIHFYIITLAFLFVVTMGISLYTIPATSTSRAAKDSLQLDWFLVPTSTPGPADTTTNSSSISIPSSIPSVPQTQNNQTPPKSTKTPPKKQNKPTAPPPKTTTKTTTTKVTTKGVWPFPGKKDPTQFRRVDQGWDLQYNSASTPVYAVEAGTVNLNHGTDTCGFGNYYPLEMLDTPLVINGRKYIEIYYGHVHYSAGVIGKHVNPGDQIAYTYPPSTCPGAWPPGWLEIGFWNPASGPVDRGAGATRAGSDMKQWLNSL